jgi:hypothetical protein
VGDALSWRVDVVLVVRDLDVAEERASLPNEEESASHEVTGGSHGGGIGVGDGHQASPEENCDLLGVDAIARDLGAMDDLHVERVTEHEGYALFRAEVREPIPTVDTLDGDDQVLAERRDGEEEADRVAGEAAVKQQPALLADDAKVQSPRVQIDPAVVLVRQLVTSSSPASSLQSGGCTLRPAATLRRGGLYEDQGDEADER